MVSTRHVGCTEGTRRAQVAHSARLEAGQATPEAFFGGQEKGNRRRDCKAASCRFYHGGVLPRVAGKPSPRDDEEQDLAHVYRLDLPEQGMPQGSVCSAPYRSSDCFYGRPRASVISGCHSWLSPDQTCCGGSNKNCIHNPFRG